MFNCFGKAVVPRARQTQRGIDQRKIYAFFMIFNLKSFIHFSNQCVISNDALIFFCNSIARNIANDQ